MFYMIRKYFKNEEGIKLSGYSKPDITGYG